MHHSESTGESPGSRRMSHPSVFAGRRGSGATAPSEEHPQPALMAHPAPTGSSSPGLHHPPHSLGIQSVGTQVKKKSGFQITSVLPAQASASANNSIADDTESYDDLDESHTEDLSSSDILDVSVSRATDTGVPERSSSEETLNSLHGGETPGVTSPNEPVMHQYMVNGVHPHAPHHHQHKAVSGRPAAVAGAPVQSGRSIPVASVESGGSAASSHSAASAPTSTEGASAPVPSGSAAPAPTGASATPATSQTQTGAATTASRFRVVKLDSNSEPFRKGRWTCTEFYEKDAPPGDTGAHRAVESVLQSEHESVSGSSSGSTVSGGDVQQTYGAPHAHPQDPGAPQALLLGADSQPVPVRAYSTEAQSGYTANTKAPGLGGQSAAPPGDYGPLLVQPAAQPLHVPPIQSAVSPRAAPLPIGIPGLPTAAATQPVSPRPQMGIPQGSGLNLEPPQQNVSQLSSSATLLLHGPMAAVQRAPLQAPYVTASQLEDAQRLLLQHHPLLALPRLAAGGMAGLVGAAVADAGLGQEGGAGAFAAAAGTDEDSSSGASVVAIDNKIEQAMDLVKSHLMYAVREEVEVLKEQIKELVERNSQLEQENTLLKNLASPEQMAQFQAQVQSGSPTAGAPAAPGPTA